MATTLALLRDRVEQILADTGNAIWSTDDVDEAIRRAIHEYSKTRPQVAIGTITLTSDAREIDVSSLSDILDVTRVWCDYTASDPEDPPSERQFEWWPDQVKIYVLGGDEPQTGDVCRIWYTKLQTLNGLDSETSTSLRTDDESLIAEGASGYAATSRAVDLAEQVTLDRLTAQQIRAWGMAQLQRFRAGLKRVAAAEALRGDARVEVDKLDHWDQSSDLGGWA
jgi:hypothetical protein